jgi:mutator protein MutT
MDTRLIVSALVEHEGKYLFIKQNKPGGAYPGTLHLVGGGVKAGETPEQAVRREVKEEVGVDLVEAKPIDFDWDLIDYKNVPTLMIYLRFRAEVPSEDVVTGSDALEALWVPVAELADVEHNPPTLRLLRRLELID